MKKALLAITLILLSSLFLAGCTNNTTNSNDTNNTNGESTVAVDFEITAAHLSFTPNVIEVQAGQTVTVRVDSIDEIHDFVIDELNVDSGLIGGGDSVIVEITVPEDASGKEYEFYCSVGDHRALGMVGTLRVL